VGRGRESAVFAEDAGWTVVCSGSSGVPLVALTVYLGPRHFVRRAPCAPSPARSAPVGPHVRPHEDVE